MSDRSYGQQYVQQQQQPVQQQPVQSTGVPQLPFGQQTLQPQGAYGHQYSIDHLPPPAPRPGQQQAQPPQQFQQQTGQQLAPQQFVPQGYAPQPQQPPYAPPPQQAPYGPAPQQQPNQPAQQRIELNDNLILDGPGVPAELRGRSWGEARRVYSALAANWLQGNAPSQTPAQQSLAQQQQPSQLPRQQFGQAPQQQPMQQPTQQGQAGQFWQNPDQRIADVVRQQIQETVLPALQPMVQQTRAQAVMQARNVAATGMADFSQLETDVVATLANATPEDLANPQVWINAADLVRGRRVAAGQYQPPRPQVPGQQPQQFGPGTAQPTFQFFTEGPTAPGNYGQPQASAQPTQTDYDNAKRWGMNIGDWMAWKNGVQANPSYQAGVR